MQEGGGGDCSMHLLLSILADGEEQARRLLGELPPAANDQLPLPAEECCRGVARKLRCTFAKAIAVAKAIEAAHGGASGTDSPRSADESSGAGKVAIRDATQAQERQGICKRRKGLPRWTEKFRIPEANLEYTPDDGLSWRKYGQKDILGAKFPRGYYRCTYRNAQSCPATKQVQRSDDDLAVFDVTYQGVHTCHQKQRNAAPPPPAAHDGSHRPATSQEQDPDVQLLASFKNSLRVETDGLPPSSSSFRGHDVVSTVGAFAFPYAASPGFLPVECGGHEHLPAGGNCFSPVSFVSPATTASAGPGYYPVEPSELGEVVSAAMSSATAPAALDPAAGFDYSVYGYQYHDDLDSFVPMFGHPSSHGQHGDA